jgi:hypothetical protein
MQQPTNTGDLRDAKQILLTLFFLVFSKVRFSIHFASSFNDYFMEVMQMLLWNKYARRMHYFPFGNLLKKEAFP